MMIKGRANIEYAEKEIESFLKGLFLLMLYLIRKHQSEHPYS